MSRPTKLTPNTIKMVAEAVRQGLTNQDVCRATGIHVASPEIPSTVEAMSCRCGGKYSEFLEFFEVPQRAREREHQENIRKPNIEAALRRR